MQIVTTENIVQTNETKSPHAHFPQVTITLDASPDFPIWKLHSFHMVPPFRHHPPHPLFLHSTISNPTDY